mmetsp:Transcript_23278/g.38309  ORF Transcript_23278/g.38309 Transcript_23278/m.38309 type:complete len:213 (-) Transcript_23278:380-1018(-)
MFSSPFTFTQFSGFGQENVPETFYSAASGNGRPIASLNGISPASTSAPFVKQIGRVPASPEGSNEASRKLEWEKEKVTLRTENEALSSQLKVLKKQLETACEQATENDTNHRRELELKERRISVLEGSNLQALPASELSELVKLLHGSLDAAITAHSIKQNNSCSLCSSALRQVVFLPCRHLCSCVGCSKTAEKCPLCLERIDDRMEVQAEL